MGFKIWGYDVDDTSTTKDVGVKEIDSSYYGLVTWSKGKSVILSGKDTIASGQLQIYGGSSVACDNVWATIDRDCYLVKSGNTLGALLTSGNTIYDIPAENINTLYFYIPYVSGASSFNIHWTVFG